MKLSLSFASLLALAALGAACTSGTSGTGDPNASSSGTPGPQGDPGIPETGPTPGSTPGNTPAPCSVAPAPGVEKPVELTADVDFHPEGAFVDSRHRALVYGWSDPALSAVSASLFVARFTADGAVDKTFGENGLVTFDSLDDSNAMPQGIAATLDGSDRVVLTWVRWSRPTGSNGERVMSAARVTANGALDTGFGQGGFVASVPLGLGQLAGNPNTGEFVTTAIDQGVNTAVAASGNEVFAYTTVKVSKTVFTGGTIDTSDMIRGVRLGPSGAKDPSYTFERKRTSFGIIGARTFGNFVYLWTEGLALKLDAKGNADPSFGLDAAHGPATVAMRSDGTLLATDFQTIYTVGPDGKRQTKLTDRGGRFTVRCDNRLSVATISSTDIKASLLLPNGALDTTRGTGGVVSFTNPSDLSSSSVVVAFDPSSGTITKFYVRVTRSAPDTLVAVRIHP